MGPWVSDDRPAWKFVWEWNKIFKKRDLRALGLALGVLKVPVASALVLVSISTRWNAVAFLAAYAAVLQAPVLHSCFCTSRRAFGVAELWSLLNTHLLTTLHLQIYSLIKNNGFLTKQWEYTIGWKTWKLRSWSSEHIEYLTWTCHCSLKERGA